MRRVSRFVSFTPGWPPASNSPRTPASRSTLPQPLGRSSGRASRAGTVENDFVVLNPEFWRSHALDAAEAFFEFEDLPADAAEKMVVVALVGALVARRTPGNFHRHNPPASCQGFQRTVNGRDPEGRHLLQCEFLNLGRRERIVVTAENCFDGSLLSGASVHRLKAMANGFKGQCPTGLVLNY